MRHMSNSGGSVLVICYGNLCRSPMAEGLLRARLGEAWEIESAGTHAYGGDAPSGPGVEAIQREHNIDISRQRSAPLTVSGMQAADHVLTMSIQQANIAASLGGNPGQVRLLGSFVPDTSENGSADPGGAQASPLEVVDPMGGSYEEYRKCLDRLHACVDGFAKWVEAGADPSDGPPPVASPGWRLQVG